MQMILCRDTRVMSPKYIAKAVWYILVRLSSLNNTMSMVSGVPPKADSVSVRVLGSEVQGFRVRTTWNAEPLNVELLSQAAGT